MSPEIDGSLSIPAADQRRGVWSGRRFSLRMLFLTVACVAVLMASLPLFGNTVYFTVLVAILGAIPAIKLKGVWRHSYLLSCTAVYLPFVGMALYTLAFIACTHCKTTVWIVLPYGPALLPVHLIFSISGMPRPSDEVWFAASLFVSAVIVIALAWVVRTRRWWWSLAAITVSMLYCTWAAMVTLALIRA